MKRKNWFLFFLLIFCLVSVGIDFFHVETGLEVDTDCPACMFHSMVYASAKPLAMAIAIILTLLLILNARDEHALLSHRRAVARNKSPPTA